MPNGDVHARIANRTAVVVVSASAIAAHAVHPLFVGIGIGGVIGLFVEPDLDHHWRTQSEQRVRRISPVIGALWSAYWSPYDWTHPHRGRSHTWPIGTVERFIYILWPLILASLYEFLNNWLFVLAFWLLVFVGMTVQDCLHIYMDGEQL